MARLRKLGWWPLLIAIIGVAFPVAAQGDPPSRVARLEFIRGKVSFSPAGVDDWVMATLNRPLTMGDRVWTNDDAFAELNIGSAVMRLNSRTSFGLTNLDDRTVQLQLTQGSLDLHIRRLEAGEAFEIDTPNQALTVIKAGDYRIDADPNGEFTTVIVRAGEIEGSSDGQEVYVRARQQARFDANDAGYAISRAPQLDDFDQWCRQRDEREQQVRSVRYVSPYVIGYEDLDAYGTWRDLPEYGAVWVPATVVYGWAPYRYGHWVWIAPWGWTWVDDAPWGFAPFHYGRWVYYSGYWGWVPGPVIARPVYAPALVAFVGGGGWGAHLAFGTGIGWFPLGPHEVYIPACRASRTYVENVNYSNTIIRNTTIINNYYNNQTSITQIKYVNQTVPGGVTAVSKEVFVNSGPVGHARVKVQPGELRRAPVMTTAEVAPVKTSVLGLHARETGPMMRPPESAYAREVQYKTGPPPRPVTFEAKQPLLEKHPGTPLDSETEQKLRHDESDRATTSRGTEVRHGTMNREGASSPTPSQTATSAPTPARTNVSIPKPPRWEGQNTSDHSSIPRPPNTPNPTSSAPPSNSGVFAPQRHNQPVLSQSHSVVQPEQRQGSPERSMEQNAAPPSRPPSPQTFAEPRHTEPAVSQPVLHQPPVQAQPHERQHDSERNIKNDNSGPSSRPVEVKPRDRGGWPRA